MASVLLAIFLARNYARHRVFWEVTKKAIGTQISAYATKKKRKPMH
jgi:hypothetical protein